jgi:hypothetical protein
MDKVLKSEQITIPLTLPIHVYEDLLASSRVIDEDPDFFVEALIACYSREFVRDMLKTR